MSRRSRWPCNQRHGSAEALLLGLRVRIPLRAWNYIVFLVCCAGSRHCDELITLLIGVLPAAFV